MNYLVVVSLMIVSAVVAMRRGIGGSFAFVYLPTLLLIGAVRPISIQPLPDINAVGAVSLGALAGLFAGGRLPPIRFHWLDGLVLACSVALAMTAFINGNFWTVITFAGNEVIRYLLPYLMARAAFFDADLRGKMAIWLSFIAMGIGSLALVEFRLWPLFVSRILQQFDLYIAPTVMVLKRGVFFRAMVTCEHPIDLGNTGMLLGGLIVAMAVTAGIPLKDKRILCGVAASLSMIVFSISFSSLFGLVAACGIFLGLVKLKGSERLLVPGVVAMIVAGFLLTQHMLTLNVEKMMADLRSSRKTGEISAVDDSYTIRVLIVQNAYYRVGVDAGWFGFGDHGLSKADLQLQSVDNSYMLFLLRRGWVGLSLRLLLGVAIAVTAAQVLRGTRADGARIPPAALVAVLIGTMVSMYTVWFGFTYSALWTTMVAITASMHQVVMERRRAMAVPTGLPAGAATAGGPILGIPAGADPRAFSR